MTLHHPYTDEHLRQHERWVAARRRITDAGRARQLLRRQEQAAEDERIRARAAAWARDDAAPSRPEPTAPVEPESLAPQRTPTDIEAAFAAGWRAGLSAAEWVAHRPTPIVAHIQRIAAEHFGLSRSVLVSQRRDLSAVWARQVAMYLTKEVTRLSLPTIGRMFGGKNHTTVLHAVRKVAARIEAEPTVAAEVAGLIDAVRGGAA